MAPKSTSNRKKYGIPNPSTLGLTSPPILMTQLLASPWSDPTRYHMKIATYQALTTLNGD